MSSMAVTHDTGIGFEKPATSFLAGSMVFHGIIVILLIIGLPYVTPELPVLEEAVPVEIVDIDELTQTNKLSSRNQNKRQDTKPEPKKEPPKPVAPQVTAKTPPKPMAPKRPMEDVVIPDKTKTPEPVKKPMTKPKAPEKPAERMLAAHNEEEQEDFQSLLRNLMPAEQEQAADPAKAAQMGQKPSMLASLGARMTISEQDALRRQLAQCWNLLAGARYAENLVVEIKLFMNADRTIRQARIMNQLRYNQDNFYRAAADGALRALYNPRCSPLDLPPEKYEQWKTITVTFDPRSML